MTDYSSLICHRAGRVIAGIHGRGSDHRGHCPCWAAVIGEHSQKWIPG
jgi:hypothetical protein